MEWPPKDVMNLPARADDPEVMKAWISGIQNWMKSNALPAGERKRSDDSIQSEASLVDTDHEATLYAHSPIIIHNY